MDQSVHMCRGWVADGAWPPPLKAGAAQVSVPHSITAGAPNRQSTPTKMASPVMNRQLNMGNRSLRHKSVMGAKCQPIILSTGGFWAPSTNLSWASVPALTRHGW